MTRLKLTIAVVLLAILACRKATPCELDPAACVAPTDATAPIYQQNAENATSTPRHVTASTPSPTAAPFVTITGDVFVRDLDGTAVGSLLAGATVQAACDGDWCYIIGTEQMFWRGCSSDPAGLKCERKP